MKICEKKVIQDIRKKLIFLIPPGLLLISMFNKIKTPRLLSL